MRKFLNVFFTMTMALLIMTSPVAANENVIDLPDDASIEYGETVRIPVGNARYVKTSEGEVFSISEVPTKESMENFIRNVNKENIDFNEQIFTRQTKKDILLDSYGSVGTTISLRLQYETSGNNNTGVIVDHFAYTQLSGPTILVGWEEHYCDSWIVGTKDVRAKAQGDVILKVFHEGFIEISRQPITLSGIAYVIR